MPIDVVLTLGMAVVFGVILTVVLVAFARRRGVIDRDIALSFAAVAGPFVVEVVAWTLTRPPAWTGELVFGMVLLHPVLTLRVAEHVGPLPRWVVPMVFAAWLVTVLAVVVLPATALVTEGPLASMGLPTIMAIAAAFVTVEVAAALFLARSALGRSGAPRARMFAAALATAAFAATVFGIGAGAEVITSSIGTEARVLALVVASVSAVGYVLAFVPPRGLRLAWQASTAFWATKSLLQLPPATPVAELWRWLADSARRSSGSDAVVILGSGPTGEVIEWAAAGVEAAPATTYRKRDLHRLLRTARSSFQGEASPADPIVDDLLRRVEARCFAVVPFSTAAADRGAVILLDRYARLFGSDDRQVIKAIGARAALIADRRVMLAEQERLSAELAATVDALRSASEAKSGFLASMSHELRTPLSAIIGFAELMQGEPGDGRTASVPREWIDHVQLAGEHLLMLINDVLDLTKVEAGRLELHPEQIGVSEAVADSIAGLRPLADRKAITIAADVGIDVLVADRGRLRQILYNLLSNAIKYTPPGGSVRVTAVAAAEGADILVSDTGIGIAPGDQAHIFEEFRQVGDSRGHEPGSGLGLALTRRLVEAHGGTIDVESDPGKGSRFWVHFPAGTGGRMPSGPTDGPTEP